MTWQDILKRDEIEKGIMDFFRRMRLPKESKAAMKLLEKGMAQALKDIKQGNVIIRAIPHEKSSYNNRVLTIGKEILGDTDPKQYIEQIKQGLEGNSMIKVTESSSQEGPSITIIDSMLSARQGELPERNFDY